ncbi:MAG: hypothetical protein L6Q97_24775 [Thermoanaerobaculia bacterium]|nr:hypothetical protein [Thermoanaerobaculia bacterium]
MQKPLIPALLCFTMLLLFGCGKSSDSPDNAAAWVVTDYEDNKAVAGNEDLFTGYSFDLNTDKTIVIHLPNGNTLPGTWSLESNNTRLIIDIHKPVPPLDGLTGPWIVKEYTDTSIKLESGYDPIAYVGVQGRKVFFAKQ